MWLMLIFLAPVGVFLLWKKEKYNKNTKIVLSVISIIIFIIGGINNFKTNEEVTKPTVAGQKQEETKKEKSMNDMTIDEYIKGTSTSIVEVTNSIDNTGYILVKDKFDSNNSKTIAFEICQVLKNLQKHKDYSKVKKVGIMIMADFTDTYGKKTEAKSLSMDISKEELDKINWDNFDYKNIYKLSSDLWVHPDIKD